MTKKLIVLLFIAILVIMVVSCKKKDIELSPDVANSDEALFELGQSFIKKDAERARLYFRQVIDSFPKSIYAQRAKLTIADSYFKEKDETNLIISAAEYREFISLFPFSPSAPYAQYRVGMSFFKKALKPGRDQTKTQQAFEEFKLVVSKYPLSEEADMAREKIKECEERLAEHTLSIAVLYYKTRAYKAARSRLKDILSNFIEYSGMDLVYFYMGDSYYKENLSEESIPYFTKLLTDYPNSKKAKKTQKRMDKIEAQNNSVKD